MLAKHAEHRTGAGVRRVVSDGEVQREESRERVCWSEGVESVKE